MRVDELQDLKDWDFLEDRPIVFFSSGGQQRQDTEEVSCSCLVQIGPIAYVSLGLLCRQAMTSPVIK